MRLFLLISAWFTVIALQAQGVKSDSVAHRLDSAQAAINQKLKTPSLKLGVPDSLNPAKKIDEQAGKLNANQVTFGASES